MKPVHQNVFGKGKGNCLQAAVASILELPLDEVPTFADPDHWFDLLTRFLSHYDLCPLLVKYDPDLHLPGGYNILTGKSPRGDFLHATVALDGEVVHDPHPDGNGIESRVDVLVFVARCQRTIPTLS